MSTSSNRFFAGGANVVPVALTAVAVVATSMWWWRRRRFQRETKTDKIVVADLVVYPIKSCAGTSVVTATPTVRGFQGDRVAQVTDANGKYCTPRDKGKEKLFHVQVKFAAAGKESSLVLTSQHMPKESASHSIDLKNTETKPVQVEVLEAPAPLTLRDYGNATATWLAQATGISGCRLTAMGPEFDRSVRVNPAQGEALPNNDKAPPMSLADEAPYLLVNAASLDDLNRRLRARGKDPVDMRRFRPNIVVQGIPAWHEDTWRRIRIGPTAEFWVWQRCGRCVMTTIDRDSLQRGPEPLATLSEFRERAKGMRNFGMHLIPCPETVGQGGVTISVHDKVEVLEYDPERQAEFLRVHGK